MAFTSVLRSPLFWFGLLLRLMAFPFFGSHFTHALFMPFLDYATLHPWSNPWAALPPAYFPYGTALYSCLLLPKWLAYQLIGAYALGSRPISLALFKLPLLGFDLLVLGQLLKLVPNRHKQIYLFYWLNPVVIFVSYVHGQLDVASTALCLAALCTLASQRIKTSAVLMALATLSKAHVVVVVPLAIVFLWNQHFTRQASRQMAVWLGIYGPLTLAGFLPHLASATFGYVTTTSPQAFQVLAAQVDLGPDRLVYVGLAIVVGLLGRLCAATRLSATGLLLGAGTLFGALVAVTGAMPGWYLWCMPYVALFYATYVVAPRQLLFVFYGLYCAHFGVAEYFADGVPAGWYGATFTLLQTCLAGILVVMWVVAVRSEAPLRGRVGPLLIGIAGDSGAGKNVLSDVMSALFEPKATAVLEGDNYHKWERGHARWGDYTHLHPRANHLEEMAAHTQDLLSGRLIFAPHYDHGTGTFTAPREVYGRKLVIVQGLHTFYLRQMRRQLDLKIFLAPHPLVRLAWKVDRDVKQRGHALEKVLESLRKREHDAQTHINPQRILADWVIEVMPLTSITSDSVLAGDPFSTKTQHILWNDAPVSDLLGALRSDGACDVTLETVLGDINRVCLTVIGAPSSAVIEQIGGRIFPELRTLTRGAVPPRWQAGQQGINQLIALSLLQAQQ